MLKDYYQILKINQQAKAQEIKQAYRRLALKYHPDRNPDNKAAEEKFKLILEAYQTLNNEENRRRYDLEYEIHIQVQFQSRPAGSPPPEEPSAGASGSRPKPRRPKPARPQDDAMPAHYSYTDSIMGRFNEYMGRRQRDMGRQPPSGVERVQVKCPDCNGRGLRHFIFCCPTCAGEGYYGEVRGSDYQACPACKGNGYGEAFLSECLCDYCDGLGIVQAKAANSPCPHCHGYGWTLADIWWRRIFLPHRSFICKKEECYWCNGTGVAIFVLESDSGRQCHECQGRGWTGIDLLRKKRTCSRCKGSGLSQPVEA